jgi:hypothetical protein
MLTFKQRFDGSWVGRDEHGKIHITLGLADISKMLTEKYKDYCTFCKGTGKIFVEDYAQGHQFEDCPYCKRD